MIVLVLAYLVSLIPAVAIILWVRNGLAQDESHRKHYMRAVIFGLVSPIAVTLGSALFALIGNFSGIRDGNALVHAVYYDFIVLALVEELVKFGTFWLVYRRNEIAYSALDVVLTAALVTLGFEISESFLYAFGTNPIQMIVRGVTLMHFAFGVIMGHFILKGMRTGNKVNYVLAVVIPWLIHGLYDFSLSEEASTAFEPIMFASLLLAAATLVISILFIRFLLRARKDPEWTTPLGGVVAPAGVGAAGAGVDVAGAGAARAGAAGVGAVGVGAPQAETGVDAGQYPADQNLNQDPNNYQ